MCEHKLFESNVRINRLEDSGQFMADVIIRCSKCKRFFRFLGLPVGLDMKGASVDVVGVEGRFAIEPLKDDEQIKYEEVQKEIDKLNLDQGKIENPN